MKKFIRFILVLAILAGALFILKPDANSFESWLKKKSAAQRGNAKGDNFVEKLVDKGATTATQVQILATYRLTDHKLVSMVEARANGEKFQYLGIAGTWVKLP